MGDIHGDDHVPWEIGLGISSSLSFSALKSHAVRTLPRTKKIMSLERKHGVGERHKKDEQPLTTIYKTI